MNVISGQTFGSGEEFWHRDMIAFRSQSYENLIKRKGRPSPQ